jgi:hypothetical protein
VAVLYLNLAAFALRTVMPPGDVQLVEQVAPGFIEARSVMWQSRVDSRLRKRYAIPFASPVPEIVLGWLTTLVTPDVYRKRGCDPTDPHLEQLEKDRDEALAEVKEASDSEEGLFDLPLNEAQQQSAIAVGGPMGTSEASAYDWIDRQAERAYGR